MIRCFSIILVFAASPALADIPTIDGTVLDEREDRDKKTGEVEKVDEQRYVNNQSVTCSMYRPGRKDAPVAAANANPAIAGLVSVSGYLIGNQKLGLAPLPPKAELQWWYQFYFATDRGRAGYEKYVRCQR